MTSPRSFVAVAAAAALWTAGCATSGTAPAPAKPGTSSAKAPAPKPADAKAPAPKPADAKAPAPKPGETKPADAKPAETKPGTAAPAPATKAPESAAPKAPDAKAMDTKAAASKEPAGATGGSGAPAGGLVAAYDAFIRRQGAKFAEAKFMGLRLRPRFSDDLSYTDNVFYQDSNEKLIVDRDLENNNVLARPNLGKPRAKVKDIVNTATLGLDFDMPLNLNLVPILGEGRDQVTLFGFSVTSVEYLLDPDSPDALNYDVHVDLPYLVNDMISRLMRIDAARHALYFRAEGDYSRITDPLDVAKFGVGTGTKSFFNSGERNDFTRTEWFVKGTLGWKGPIFDALVSCRHYRLDLEDESLQPADHYERETYGEVGHSVKRSEHRLYGFYEHTEYNFFSRGYPDPLNAAEEDNQALRDFAKIRTGLGWEGPLASKKIRGNIEVYYLATNVRKEGPLYTHPVDVNPHTGLPVAGAGTQRFDERGMVAGMAEISYRPFVTKGTQLTAEYERNVDYSVVAQDKVVDKGALTFTHPINERLTGEVSASATMENMQHREKRLYTEFGIGTRYKLAAFTEVYLRYTLRHMRSRREPVTAQSDAANETYLLKADGDFTANIVSVGITIQF